MQLTVETYIGLGHRGSKYAAIEEAGALTDHERGDGFLLKLDAPLKAEGGLEEGVTEAGIEM